MRRYLCGVPARSCRGQVTVMVAGMRRRVGDTPKVHSSPQEAFECHAAWLLEQGYQRVSRREFKTPEGPILVLSKPRKFGAPMRLGKTIEGGSSGSRVVPKKVGKHAPMGGVIVG